MRHPNPEHAVMSFGDHLEDLRRRLILSLVGVIPIFLIALWFGEPLLDFLLIPVQRELRARELPAALQATGPLETFGAYVRVALMCTVIVGAPWIFFQLWKFIAPGLYRHERRFVHLLAPMSVLLTALGAVFMYAVMLPVVLAFFIGFGSGADRVGVSTAPLPPGISLPSIPVLEHDPTDPSHGQEWINSSLLQRRVCIQDAAGLRSILGTPLTRHTWIVQHYRISEYVKMFFGFAIAFSLGFQTPVVVLLLGWAGLVQPAWFNRNRKYVIFGCIIAAAVLTPADPFSMLILAGPLVLLFELGMLLLRVLPADRVARGLIAREPADAGDP